jgi:hypothetical protein
VTPGVIGRRPAILLLATVATVVLFAVVSAGRVLGVGKTEHERTVGYGQIRFDGAGPERWAARYRATRRQLVALRVELRRERRVLLQDPNVVEAINLACATYGYCSTLWRVARCETHDTLLPAARNPTPVGDEHASGLFQFLPSTFRSTPYGRFPIWSPYASALAAGWMHEQGRGGEWSCR